MSVDTNPSDRKEDSSSFVISEPADFESKISPRCARITKLQTFILEPHLPVHINDKCSEKCEKYNPKLRMEPFTKQKKSFTKEKKKFKKMLDRKRTIYCVNNYEAWQLERFKHNI